MLDKHISQLEQKITEMFSGDSMGHNIDHLRRTLSNAVELQKREGGDLEVIGVSAFIHDVHRIMENKEKRYITPKESLPQIKELIADLKLTEKQKDHICHAIEFHEQYNFGGNPVTVTDIETLILQDADNLDAIGAIPITRCIQYTLGNGGILYDPNIPLYSSDNYDDTKFDPTVIHHIYNKLLRLGENMNTETARKMSIPKTKLMQDFIEMFIQEWR